MPRADDDGDPSAKADALIIRDSLRTHDRVRIECEDESEAIEIGSYLTAAERGRVVFFWKMWS